MPPLGGVGASDMIDIGTAQQAETCEKWSSQLLPRRYAPTEGCYWPTELRLACNQTRRLYTNRCKICINFVCLANQRKARQRQLMLIWHLLHLLVIVLPILKDHLPCQYLTFLQSHIKGSDFLYLKILKNLSLTFIKKWLFL